jgi:RNA polymerase sigma-70 factor (ECF subfamily)
MLRLTGIPEKVLNAVMSRSEHAIQANAGVFATTHWSVVLAATQPTSPQATEALERLCRTYWYPLYAFVRRQGQTAHDAEDLIQEFFARLLKGRDLESVRRERGRFRSFLLVSLKHFLINEGLRSRTQKRGGGHPAIPLDEVLAENRYGSELADDQTPEKIFERRWALALLDQVLTRLGEEHSAAGKLRQFEALRGFLSNGDRQRSQAEIATELGTSEGAVKQAVHQLRRRYRELLRQEVAHTVATASDIESELSHLVAVLRS